MHTSATRSLNSKAKGLILLVACGIALVWQPVYYDDQDWLAEEYSGGCYTSTYPPGVLTRYGRYEYAWVHVCLAASACGQLFTRGFHPITFDLVGIRKKNTQMMYV